MPLFHYDNYISLRKLLLGDGSLAIKARRFGFESICEQLGGCPAPVLALVADEEDFHTKELSR